MKTARKHFDVFARNWQRLPRAGALRRAVKRDADGGLQAIEARVVASRVALGHWEVGGDELAISIIVGTVIIGPRRYDEAAATLATVGMHALARYFERSGDGSDAATERDLRVLLHAYPATVETAGEFRIPTAAAGAWAGAVMMAQADAQPVMAVRTFTPRETGGFRFADAVRLTRAGAANG